MLPALKKMSDKKGDEGGFRSTLAGNTVRHPNHLDTTSTLSAGRRLEGGEIDVNAHKCPFGVLS